MRRRYDSRRAPAAPVVAVTVRRPDGRGRGRLVHALLDTGADVTVLPSSLVTALGAPPAGERYIRGVGAADVYRVRAYFVEFELDDRCQLVEVVALGDEPIAGRNWLNSFDITLYGPQQVVTINAPSSADEDA